MLEGKLLRQKDGKVSLYLRSAALEEIVKGLSANYAVAWEFADAAVEIGGNPVRVAKVYRADAVRYAGEAAGISFADPVVYNQKVSMAALATVGLREGVMFHFHNPLPAAVVKSLGESIRTAAKTILDSARVVDLSIKIAPDGKVA